MKVGDLVTNTDSPRGPIGVIVKLTKRWYIPAAMVLIEGKVMELDIENLWRFHESR